MWSIDDDDDHTLSFLSIKNLNLHQLQCVLIPLALGSSSLITTTNTILCTTIRGDEEEEEEEKKS